MERTEGILRKLQKVMKFTKKWKDFENNFFYFPILVTEVDCHQPLFG
jgi:hypothetical protein